MKSSAPSRKKSASNRVVCGSKLVSKKKQIHEDARKMYRTKTPGKKLSKMGKTTVGRP